MLCKQIEAEAEWSDGSGCRLILRLPLRVA
jgi:hypothetical protein